ncbi:hypothetical protein EUX98_g2269 [Antrodiella citrinella]|uniref:Uncharacterized protein n=1 Tax=Antrodiella citrinella TaxID=2447956 RepID=A0A4V3XJ66_9APHY|nr:hypothetical protein EUX98_g2269 [Antrodiella citrinella]
MATRTLHPNKQLLIQIRDVTRVYKLATTPSLRAFKAVPGLSKKIDMSSEVTAKQVEAAKKVQVTLTQGRSKPAQGGTVQPVRTAGPANQRSAGGSGSRRVAAADAPNLVAMPPIPVSRGASQPAATAAAALHPNGERFIRIKDVSRVYKLAATPSAQAFVGVPGLSYTTISGDIKVTAEQVEAASKAHTRPSGGKAKAKVKVKKTPERSPYYDYPDDSPDDSDDPDYYPSYRGRRNASYDSDFDLDDARGILEDIDTQWGMMPQGGAYKESNHYRNGTNVG